MERKKKDSRIILVTLVLALIILFLLNRMLRVFSNNGSWDYEKINSATDIMYLGTVVTDRPTYYLLESIVQKYLNSYTIADNNNEDELDYTEYYRYLSEGYKKYLTKSEYEKIASNFLKKFDVNVGSEYETMSYMDTEHIIKRIYYFEDNIYFCELKGQITNNTGYIAIALNENDNIYNFVYIE